jgi:hypothetical protein
MAASTPFFRGKDVTLRIYQDGKPVYIPAKNWKVTEEAHEAADGVNGEDRDRLDKVTNYYSATVDIFQNDQELMTALIAAQDEDDASNLPLSQAAAIQIRQRDGRRAVYLLEEAKFGPWDMNQGGRAEAVMLTLKLRFRYYKPAPSAF